MFEAKTYSIIGFWGVLVPSSPLKKKTEIPLKREKARASERDRPDCLTLLLTLLNAAKWA